MLFRSLPRNAATITLAREAWDVPADYSFGGEALVPLRAGERVGWRVVG